MAVTTPPPGSCGQRTLAAIVFTDVVGFSARMQRDEVATLALLQRDFAEMRRVCAAHGGAVLKTTGDGLLMTFSSAVQAVACALSMQRQFAVEAQAGQEGTCLQHRVGIHLGDVLVQDQDVMGDGVNIAARLQAEADPGGICISQTVYDVVKNKLELHVISLGARDLKNIAETIPIYRLLMDAHALGTTTGPGFARSSPNVKPGARRWLIAGGATVVIVASAAWMGWRGRTPAPPPIPEAAPVPGLAVAAPGVDEADREIAARLDAFQQLRAQYLDTYDFEGLARAMREQADTPAGKLGQQPLMARAAENLVVLRDWLGGTMRSYNRARPLTFSDPTVNSGAEMKAYVSAERRLVFVENGVLQASELSEVKPAVLGAMIVAAVRHAKPPAPRDAVLGAVTYAKVYHLPAMQQALAQARPNLEKAAGRRK